MKRLIQLISITSLIAFSALHAEVDSAESSPESSTSVESTKSQESKSGAFGFCKGKVANTGCFIGAEVGVALTQNDFSYGNYVQTSPALLSQDFATIPVNLIFGHQWYYALNQGVRFKAHIGYTNYNSSMPSFRIIGEPDVEYNMSVSSHALQYGLDVAWVYDFIANDKHNFGLDFNVLGVEGTSFVANSGEMADATIFRDSSAGVYTKFAYSGGLGLHYFYNAHHQFFVEYRYRSYTTTHNVEFIGAQGHKTSLTLSSTPTHTFALAYAYKF